MGKVQAGQTHRSAPTTGDVPPAPRLVAWEVTRRCNLACVHCRAAAANRPFPGELTLDEGRRLLDEIASIGQSVVILTGGEPLLREDLVDLVRHGSGRGLRMVLATNGTLLTAAPMAALRDAGLRRVSVSLDAATADRHDAFRAVPGAFAGAMGGLAVLREAGLPFQINSTLTRETVDQMEGLLALAAGEGGVAWHIFLLVEVGRGRDLREDQLSPAEYEAALEWLAAKRETATLPIKVTCAPQFQRILRQRAAPQRAVRSAQCAIQRIDGLNTDGLSAVETRGCLAGTGFCFVSSRGILSPCGYLELDCGDVRQDGFVRAWRESAVLRDLRDVSRLKGKCGVCEYRAWCGGCRARAYAATGDYLAEEPCCIHVPGRKKVSGPFLPERAREHQKPRLREKGT